jgi:hypothetical protein
MSASSNANLLDDFRNAVAAAGPGAEIVEASAGSERLVCDLAEVQPLACAVRRLTLRTDRWSDITNPTLKEISEHLESRLTYLLEPVGPIEVDPLQCVVQMRSKPPQSDDDGTRYYELLVAKGGEISLSRYEKQPRTPRQLIPAVLTREVLLRLAADFLTAAEEYPA